MILTVDIGNSNIVLGGYESGHLTFTTRFSTDRTLEADQYAVQLQGLFHLHKLNLGSVEGVMLSSVVPEVTRVLSAALRHVTGEAPRILTLADAGAVQVKIKHPEELGMDILATAIAAGATYPLPAAIIDMGTATKLTALDAAGAVLGVSIAPGVFVSLRALVGNASLLQSIGLENPGSAIGRTSAESMKSGVLLGHAAMLDGMLDRFEAEMGTIATVVATGGASHLVVPHCRHTILLSETLLLDGLYAAYLAHST